MKKFIGCFVIAVFLFPGVILAKEETLEKELRLLKNEVSLLKIEVLSLTKKLESISEQLQRHGSK
ncbi:MAG: hypothetical protein OEY38_21870 [Gammaproteobacteria bacterium]|nr:hypothetical protein [Gammaproteobacteria bacterium]